MEEWDEASAAPSQDSCDYRHRSSERLTSILPRIPAPNFPFSLISTRARLLPIGERSSLERNTSNTTVSQLPASGVIPRIDKIETMAASDASDDDASYFRVLHA
jgi:hypothetical protein